MPCKWHPLTAMENAAKDGFTYDADAVVLPVKCTGLVKVSYLLKLFAKGVRGVLVLGCDEGDCRYYNGSARCAEIVDETREILDLAGVTRDRLQFHMIAESGGSQVKRVLKGFLKEIGKVTAARAKGNGGKGEKAVKPGGATGKSNAGKAKRTAKAARPKPKPKQPKRVKKTAGAAKSAKAGTKPKPPKPKASKKKTRPAKRPVKTATRKKSADTRKPTGATRTVKARKGTKRGSSRRHK